MLREPPASEATPRVATPATSGPLPMVVAPSLNVTDPVGVPAPGAVAETVAVKMTCCPKTLGFAEEASAIPVKALLTVCATAEEVEPTKSELPPYTALIVWEPTVSDAIEKFAPPPHDALPILVVAPSLNVTDPVGVPAPGAVAETVAVKMTCCPKTLGFAEEA